MVANSDDKPEGSATPRRDLHALYETAAHNLIELDQLCRKLEMVADGLPVSVDIGTCNDLAANLYVQVKSVHEFEEAELFPLLVSRNADLGKIVGIIERLRFEHWEDEAYANEVQEALRKFATAPRNTNIEGLSWMLRGFFESVRRHVAFERDYVLPMLDA